MTMKKESLQLLLSLLLPGLTGCVIKNTIQVAQVEKPLHARLIVREETIKPCPRIDRFHCFYKKSLIVLAGGRELPYGCPAQTAAGKQGQIATDASGEQRIAYRCQQTDPWKVIYLGGGKRSFQECSPYQQGPGFDWSRVPGLVAVAPRLVNSGCSGVKFTDLVEELSARGGPAAVADLLHSTLGAKTTPSGNTDHRQEWDDAFAALPAGEKARLIPAFRQAILSEGSLLALERALRHTDLSDPAYAPALSARIQRMLEGAPSAANDTAMDRMLRRLAQSDPAGAARLACREIQREKERGALLYLPGALLAVAHAQEPCPLILGNLAESNCDAAFSCAGSGASGRICSAQELAGDIQKALHESGPLSFQMRDRALLAAALPLPQARGVLEAWQRRCAGQ